MDFTLDPVQTDLREACTTLLARHAGTDRARELRARGGVDAELFAALDDAGFLDLAPDPDAGPLAATLVTEWTAAAGGVGPVGARTLVAPAVLDAPPRTVTVADRRSSGPVRFGTDVEAVVLVDGADAVLARRGGFTAVPVPSSFGHPLARIETTDVEPLAPGAGDTVRRWWQVALAAEIAGCARGALERTTRYLTEREQFGRPLATFQALQHRLADCHVRVEGTSWLTRLAAERGAPADLAASAATAAVETAGVVLQETHQLTGAMGFTLEYDLHVWTLRLQDLRLEAGGVDAHADALVAARWG
ncbi:acyl-CoA dehydrogenase [Pseudonocardia sp. NPDC049154]|uniref:acyl-CoA dehydrogenase n=1 Tax=Pseudonocardia sp. NPDC049154 TaxID=3155501 RepID=UPI0033FC2447